MIIKLHIAISLIFFAIGFCMRYGLAKSLVQYFYHTIPKLSKEEFNESRVRRFIGETSIKLGVLILTIAVVGMVQPESLTLAVILGWICFAVLAVGSITFLEKIDLFQKVRQRIKQEPQERQGKDWMLRK